ncbi:unnamed protein product, partial [Urochloa humidicola]
RLNFLFPALEIVPPPNSSARQILPSLFSPAANRRIAPPGTATPSPPLKPTPSSVNRGRRTGDCGPLVVPPKSGGQAASHAPRTASIGIGFADPLLPFVEFVKQDDPMRFFRGSKVEVLQEAEVPFGSWRPGEIVSGNGHTYLVRYEESPVDSGVAVERVPRRLMRPRPPADDPVCWAVGGILEAFDTYSWKVAEVVRLLGKRQYLVRLLGSSLELRAHASDLRLRKLWIDDKWIVTQKYSAKCLDGSFRGRPKDGNLGCNLGMDSHVQLENHNAFESATSRGIKRKSSAITTHPQCSEITKRLRTPHRDGGHSKLVDRGSLRLAEKG